VLFRPLFLGLTMERIDLAEIPNDFPWNFAKVWLRLNS
jgi:hypothetical protein